MSILCIILANIISCLQLDVVIVADVSMSVRGQEQFITEAIDDFRDRFRGTDVRICLITFSNNAQMQFHLGDSSTFEIETNGYTNLADAIFMARDELFGSHARLNYRKMIIIISDGDCDNAQATAAIISEVKMQGVGVGGILIKSGSEDENFMREVSDVYVETKYNLLSQQLKKLDICL